MDTAARAPALGASADFAKRDSSLMIATRSQNGAASAVSSQEAVFEVGGRFETRSLAALAEEVFRDPELTQLCEKGLNLTLQRTKDGATAESRIQELAGTISTLM